MSRVQKAAIAAAMLFIPLSAEALDIPEGDPATSGNLRSNSCVSGVRVMASEEVQGEWRLVRSASIKSEIEFVNDEPHPNGVSDWLNGFDESLVDRASPTSGLTLSISPKGSFTERLSGKPNVYWFDNEGVLQTEVAPFDGVVVGCGQEAYLRPAEIAKWATPEDGEYGRALLRYDDGDTKIADRIRTMGDRLVRVVNIVTDDLYLDRVVIVYERMR